MPARGTKATLDTHIEAIREGEIVFATDLNALYIKEDGVLTAVVAGLPANGEIGDALTFQAQGWQAGGNLTGGSF